jgi:hypothetical protein
MKFLTYAPSVEAYLQTEDGRVLDLSSDIARGSVTRNVDAPSICSITLSNRGKKYNGVIQPMDKIVVFMTRTKRIQVFAGYVDSAPFYQMYPGDITIECTCTLKRLTNFYWDEAIAERELSADKHWGTSLQADTAWKNAAMILIDIVKWPVDQIHVGNISTEFLKWASNLYLADMSDEKDKLMKQKLIDLLAQGEVSIGGGTDSGATAGGDKTAGGGGGGGAGIPTNLPSGCAAKYGAKIAEMSKQYGIPAAYICAVIKQESGWNPNSNCGNTNGTRDLGLMQVNTCHKDQFPDYFKGDHWKDGNYSIQCGCRILVSAFSTAKTHSKDMETILLYTYAIYNGGGGGWKKSVCLGRSRKVLAYYHDYLKHVPVAAPKTTPAPGSGEKSPGTGVGTGDKPPGAGGGGGGDK